MIAQTHRLNLRVCKNLANQFGANNVEIYFVIPAKNSFKPTPLEHFGDLAAFGWPKSKKGVTERLMENVVRVTGWYDTDIIFFRTQTAFRLSTVVQFCVKSFPVPNEWIS